MSKITKGSVVGGADAWTLKTRLNPPLLCFRLRSQLVHSPDDDTKYLNVHVIQQMLNDKYSSSPATEISTIEAHKVLAEAFPSVQQKRMTKSGVKSTFLVGVSMASSSPAPMTSSASYPDQERQQLMQRISELEEEVAQQKVEICSLKRSQHLINQAERAMSLATNSSKGPDSHERLSEFSVDTIISELSECSPDLYQFFQLVGDTARSSSSKLAQLDLSVQEMKVIMSLCTILNARCNRFKGMQLLLSFMLIARGTSKQVCLRVTGTYTSFMQYCRITWHCTCSYMYMYMHMHYHTHKHTIVHIHMHTCTCTHTLQTRTYMYSSYVTLIGVHEMHGRVHPN